MNAIPYIIQGSNIVVFANNKPNTITASHPNHAAILKAIKAKEWDKIEILVEIPKSLAMFSDGIVTVKNDQVMYKGTVVNSSLTRRMLEQMSAGFDISHFVKFMTNLYSNPSNRAVNELFGFLENNNLPITDDGCFLAYKLVRRDYKDVYSGKFDNSVGATVSMDRNMVDENKDATCSYGLHFCSYSYLTHYSGDRIVVLKINPSDVVSIPSDYNNQKGRCCKYEVVSEIKDVTDAKQNDCLSNISPVVTVRNGKVKASLNWSDRQKVKLELVDLIRRNDGSYDQFVEFFNRYSESLMFDQYVSPNNLTHDLDDEDFEEVRYKLDSFMCRKLKL